MQADGCYPFNTKANSAQRIGDLRLLPIHKIQLGKPNEKNNKT